MRIAACFIIKDDSELPKLRKAIASIFEHVDAIYITATGKDVKTIEEYCKVNKEYGLHYSYHKWNDSFADARNFNFSQVPHSFDWIWWMDTDDILIGGENLRMIAQKAKENGKDVVFFTYWYGCTFKGEPSPQTMQEVLMEQNRERLLKPGVTTWKKRLHETPIPVSGAKNNYSKYLYEPNERPIVVMHTSQDTELPEKMQRNKRLLELELRDEQMLPGGADPRTLLYLMKIYAEQDEEKNWEKVLIMGEEYLAKSGWNEERATCWEQMGIVWGKLKDYPKSAESFHKAIAEWPNQPLLYIRLATAYFNIGNFSFSEHWAKLGANLDIDNGGSNLTNIKAMKAMYAELLVKLNWNARRDTKKALEAAKLLMQEVPTPANAEQVEFIENFDKLNDACRNVDELCQYLDLTDYQDSITKILDVLPDGITTMPFAQKIRNQFTKPRRWEENEICYFANFGQAHFEKWDYSSLNTGIGGSETAALKLAEEWAHLGYKVTIYSDPFIKGVQKSNIGMNGNVTILPWYYFNPRDSFNILIQWRTGQLAGKLKYKKFFVDLHDIFAEVDYDQDKLNSIDKIFVKSQYHRLLAPNVPDKKFAVVGNGV